MRSMFGPGKNRIEFGLDWAAAEARVQGHYVYNYEGGPELAEMLVADKPNSVHSMPLSTQVLTKDKGWITFSDLTMEDEIAQWENNVITFVKPTNIIIRKSDSDIYTFENKVGFKMVTTDLHRVLLFNKVTEEYETMLAKDVPSLEKYTIPTSGIYQGEGISELTNDMIKLLVAIQADGTLAKDCSAIQFGLYKRRKIERFENLLISLDLKYTKTYIPIRTEQKSTLDGYAFRINSCDLTILLRSYLNEDKSFKNSLFNMNYEQRQVFLDEIHHWDGTLLKNGTTVLDTTSKLSRDFIQTLYHLHGIKTQAFTYNKKNKSFNSNEDRVCTIYRVVQSKRKPFISTRTLNITHEYSEEMVGCVSVPSTYIMVKQEDNVFVSGNCLSSDTEVLTEDGWIDYKSINKDTLVCQWSKIDNTISFVKPTDIIQRQHNDHMVHILGERIDHLVSLEHRIVVYNEDSEAYVDVLAKDLNLYAYNNPNCFIPASGSNLINDTLDDVINYYLVDCKEDFEFINSKESGHFVASYNKDLIDQLQEDLFINNCIALINIKETHKGPLYQTLVPKKIKNLKGHYLKHTTIKVVDYALEDKTIWCVSVPSTYIVTRRNNKINISGNCVNSRKMGISRDMAKTFAYSILYGAGPPKLAKSLGVSLEEAKKLYKAYWEGLPGLLQLKTKVEEFWESTHKRHIKAIDGRNLLVRSKHSLLNLLFQSAGALLVKYVIIEVCNRLEELGLLGDPFVDSEDAEKVFLMIVYHKHIVALYSNIH